MRGRYGTDQLNRFLLFCSIGCLLVSLFVRVRYVNTVFWVAAVAMLVFTYVRMFSRNLPRRYAENVKFLHATAGIRKFFRVKRLAFRQRKEYKFFTCPSCGQEVRVPRGRGHIRITCPKCRAEFEKTT